MKLIYLLSMRILFVVALCSVLSVRAQEVVNVQTNIGASEDGIKKYFITYDLVAPHSNIPCLVQVRFTAGASTTYLKLVTGDVGNLVMPGKGKKIIWDYQEELIHFSSDAPRIDIEVFPNVTVASKVKRSKNLSVNMDSIYTKDKHYTFILYRKEKELVRLLDMPLSRSSFSIEIEWRHAGNR